MLRFSSRSLLTALGICVLTALVSYLAIKTLISGYRARAESQEEADRAMAGENNRAAVRRALPNLSREVEVASEEVLRGLETQAPATKEVSAATEHNNQESYGDTEWAGFPRSDFDLADAFFSRPTRITGGELFRHKILNPTDKYVPKAARDGLDSVLIHYGTKLRRTESLEASAATRELRALIEAGRATTTSTSQVMSNLNQGDRAVVDEAIRTTRAALRAALEKAEPGSAERLLQKEPEVMVPSVLFRGKPHPHLYTADGDLVFSATLDDLPGTQRVAALRDFLVVEFAGAVTGWFVTYCELGDAHRVDLLTNLADARRKTR